MNARILLALFPSLVLGACGVYTIAPYVIRDFELGKTKEATVGTVMIAWETGKEELQYKKWLVDRRGLRKELVYGGMVQGVVQINYREYAVDARGAYARPAFNQELKYDSSGSITFRDVKIKIESVDQGKIVFTLIQEPAETQAGTSSIKPKQ